MLYSFSARVTGVDLGFLADSECLRKVLWKGTIGENRNINYS